MQPPWQLTLPLLIPCYYHVDYISSYVVYYIRLFSVFKVNTISLIQFHYSSKMSYCPLFLKNILIGVLENGEDRNADDIL